MTGDLIAAGYAMHDINRLAATGGKHGPDVGIFAERLLDSPLPLTRMRAIYGLLGLAAATANRP